MTMRPSEPLQVIAMATVLSSCGAPKAATPPAVSNTRAAPSATAAVAAPEETAPPKVTPPEKKNEIAWRKELEATRTLFPTAIRSDAGGNVFLAGSLGGQAHFGDHVLSSRGGDDEDGLDAFVAKFDAEGRALWAVTWGDERNDVPVEIALDHQGAVVVISQGFLGGDRTIAKQVHVTKIDPTGKRSWQVALQADIVSPQHVTIDGSDNVLVAGSFGLTLTLDGRPLLRPRGKLDNVYLLELSSSGKPVWSKALSGSRRLYVSGLAADTAGDLFVSGGFSGALDLGGGPLTTTGEETSGYLAKFDPRGKHVWSKRSCAQGASLRADERGNLLFSGAGDPENPVDLGDGPLPGEGRVVARYDGSGKPLWHARVPEDAGGLIGLDEAGNPLFVDTINDITTPPEEELAEGEAERMHLVRKTFDTSGKLTSKRQWTLGNLVDLNETRLAMTLDPRGVPILAGSIQSRQGDALFLMAMIP